MLNHAYRVQAPTQISYQHAYCNTHNLIWHVCLLHGQVVVTPEQCLSPSTPLSLPLSLPFSLSLREPHWQHCIHIARGLSAKKDAFSFIAPRNEVIRVKLHQMCLFFTPGPANCLLLQPHSLHNYASWQTTLPMLMMTKEQGRETRSQCSITVNLPEPDGKGI